MYFTETRGNKIGRITPSGQITEFTVPTPSSSPADSWPISAFPGGVWFAERAAGKLAWMSVDGEFREFRLPGTARPESLVLDFVGHGLLRSDGGLVPRWDEPARRPALGQPPLRDRRRNVRDAATRSSNSRTRATPPSMSRLGWPHGGVCPGFCPVTYIELDVPRRAEVEATASEVPSSLNQRLFQITGIEPEISDVPETRAWVVDETRPGVRIEVPLVSYWTIATMQPPLPRGSNGPQPSLTFPVRRRCGLPDPPDPGGDRDRGVRAAVARDRGPRVRRTTSSPRSRSKSSMRDSSSSTASSPSSASSGTSRGSSV